MSDSTEFDWTAQASLFNHGQITLKKAHCHGWLRRVLGPIEHGSRSVEIVNAVGTSISGRIRHGETRGQTYYLLESSDAEFGSGLQQGDHIRLELRNEATGITALLHATAD